MPRIIKKFAFLGQSLPGEVAKQQREYFNQAADRIQRGESLDGMDVDIIANALRAFAARIPDEPPRRKGREPSKLDPSGLAMRYALLINKKQMTRVEAIQHLAVEADVTDEAVKYALNKFAGKPRIRRKRKTK